MSTNSTSPWMTSGEAAAYLGVSKKTILEWARRGQIKGYVLSGYKRHTWRFRQEDLDASLAVTAACQDAVLQSPRSSAASIH
jgi:excisionase family DNA binding protein